MKMIKKIPLAFCLCFSLCWAKSKKVSDKGLTTPEMIKNHNYPVETHYLKTEDGYILQVHRIPYNIKSKIGKKGTILLMHGLCSSSADWVILGPNRSLAYILSDLGYDVWIGNARGNSYSRNHTTLDPDTSAKFWDFSWHEIGYYDLPAIIDYMLDKTGDTKFYYIGHSQGTTILFVLLTTRIEYNAKIKLASLMGVSAILQNTLKLIKILAERVDLLIELCNTIRLYETPLAFVRDFGMQNCDYPKYLSTCINLINFFAGGDDTPQIDLSLMSSIFTNTPSSASMKQAFHYLHLARSGKFHQYDFGREKNLQKYGSVTPPDYNLSLITAPLAFYSGLNDPVTHYKDTNIVARNVSNLVENYLIPYELFNHVDFIIAKDVVELFYGKLLSVLAKF